MKRIAAATAAALLTFSGIALADTYVDGYWRSDGTYVAPHYRSSPNTQRYDNYGTSRTPTERYNPYARDSDGDGIANTYDMDDNNNGVMDDNERRSRGW